MVERSGGKGLAALDSVDPAPHGDRHTERGERGVPDGECSREARDIVHDACAAQQFVEHTGDDATVHPTGWAVHDRLERVRGVHLGTLADLDGRKVDRRGDRVQRADIGAVGKETCNPDLERPVDPALRSGGEVLGHAFGEIVVPQRSLHPDVVDREGVESIGKRLQLLDLGGEVLAVQFGDSGGRVDPPHRVDEISGFVHRRDGRRRSSPSPNRPLAGRPVPSPPMSRFTNRIAFLTGAASGVGQATTIRLASEGAAVFAVDVNTDGLAETAELADNLEGSVTTRRLDVTDVADIAAAVTECVDALGGIDIVGNIAGIARHHHIAEVSEADWDVMNSINLKGPFFVAQATMPHLLERNGALINIASNAGLMGQAYTVPYCATKGGVVNLTRALAMEFVKTGVRINAIAPGGIDTPLVHNFELADDIDFSLMQNHIGYRDPSSAEQIAAFFAFLASDEAANIHGSILSADGGLTTA